MAVPGWIAKTATPNRFVSSRQFDDRGLGDRIRRDLRPAVDTGMTGDVDDAAASPLDHARQYGSGADEDAMYVDLHRTQPFVRVDLPQWTNRTGDTGVVDQDIHRPELLPDGAQRLFDILALGDVGGQGQRLTSLLLNQSGCFHDLIGRASAYSDRGIGRGQCLGDGPSNAPSATRDKGNLPAQVVGSVLEREIECGRHTRRLSLSPGHLNMDNAHERSLVHTACPHCACKRVGIHGCRSRKPAEKGVVEFWTVGSTWRRVQTG